MRSKSKIFFVLLLTIGTITSIMHWNKVHTQFNIFCATLAYPFLRVHNAVTQKIHSLKNWRATVDDLQTQICALQAEREQLIKNLIQCQACSTYTTAIEPLLLFKNRYRLEHTHPVQIIFTHTAADEHYILIEGGNNYGFTDQFIAIKDNHLIGRVTQVCPYHSKVTLITDKRIKVAAYCAKTRANGIYSGANRPNTGLLHFVHHLQPLELGDLVISSGQGQVYPQGFCLGKIDLIQKKEVEYEVLTRPLIEFENLDYCLVVHPNDLYPHTVTKNNVPQESCQSSSVQHVLKEKIVDAPCAEPAQPNVQ